MVWPGDAGASVLMRILASIVEDMVRLSLVVVPAQSVTCLLALFKVCCLLGWCDSSASVFRTIFVVKWSRWDVAPLCIAGKRPLC